jgi:two-component system, cell cycle sensor histidine kinase and response regulator CckA
LANQTGGPQSVLIVDGEEAVLGVCARILEQAGFRVLKAKDSAAALQICTTHSGPIDALLTDLMLVPRGFQIASS